VTLMPPNRADPTYASENLVTSRLRTSNALNGATVRIAVSANGAPRRAVIEGFEIVVDYRPPGTLRPLRGCLTLRLGDDAPGSLSGYRGVSPIQNFAPWRPRDTDAAYLAGSGAQDVNDCALMDVQSGSSSYNSKLHIVGSVYAPTAAVQFAGNDNEAAFVTDGIVVRHLTVMRWRRGPNTAGLGGGSVLARDPRIVRLQAWYRGACVAEAEVELDDYDRDGVDEARARKWEVRPSSCARVQPSS